KSSRWNAGVQDRPTASAGSPFAETLLLAAPRRRRWRCPRPNIEPGAWSAGTERLGRRNALEVNFFTEEYIREGAPAMTSRMAVAGRQIRASEIIVEDRAAGSCGFVCKGFHG